MALASANPLAVPDSAVAGATPLLGLFLQQQQLLASQQQNALLRSHLAGMPPPFVVSSPLGTEVHQNQPKLECFGTTNNVSVELAKPVAVQQPVLEKAIWELLIAKSHVFSMFGPSISPPSLSLQQQVPIGSPFRGVGSASMEWDSGRTEARRLGRTPPAADNDNSVAADNHLVESISRNKLGRSYNPGRPLGMLDRQKILELYQKGLKISHIAKVIGVTHSCVSKIMTRYRRTGSIHPRSAHLLAATSRREPQQAQLALMMAASGQQQQIVPSPISSHEWEAHSGGLASAGIPKCPLPSAFRRIALAPPNDGVLFGEGSNGKGAAETELEF